MSFTPTEARVKYISPAAPVLNAVAALLYCMGGHLSFLPFDKYMIP